MYKIECFKCGYIFEMSARELNALQKPGVISIVETIKCPVCGEDIKIQRLPATGGVL